MIMDEKSSWTRSGSGKRCEWAHFEGYLFRMSRFDGSIDLGLDRYQERITDQTARLGSSSDWNRVAFTMDEVGLTSDWYLDPSTDCCHVGGIRDYQRPL
jgi:hypothetical protein